MSRREGRWPSLQRKLSKLRRRGDPDNRHSGPDNQSDTFVRDDSSDLCWTDLKTAIENNDVITVERFVLLKDSMTYTPYFVNIWCDKCGAVRSALELSAHCGHVVVWRKLMEKAVDQELHQKEPNYAMYKMSRLLDIACRHGHVILADALIEHGKDSWIPRIRSVLRKVLLSCMLSDNIRVVREIQTLMVSLGFRHNIVELTYREGLNVRILNRLGMENEEIIAHLFEFDCPQPHQIVFMNMRVEDMMTRWWTLRDHHGRSALDQACLQGDVRVIETLLRLLTEAQCEFNFDFLRHGFDLACQHGRCDVVDFILWRTYAVDWLPVLENSIKIALEARQMNVAKLLILRLVAARVKRDREAKPLSAWKRKDLSSHLKQETVECILKYGSVDLLDILCQEKVITDDMLAMHGYCDPVSDFLLLKHVGSFSVERLDIIHRGAKNLNLVAYELLIHRVPQTIDVFIKLINTLFVCVTNFYNSATKGERRKFMLIKLGILLECCWKVPSLLRTFMQRLKQVNDLWLFDILFELYDFSPCIMDMGGRACFGTSGRDTHYDDLLNSMCAWSGARVLLHSCLAKDRNDPTKKRRLLQWFRETGISTHEDDIEDLMVDTTVVPLKGLCRISILRHLRQTWTCRSMAALIVNLYNDSIIPRSLIPFLLFRAEHFVFE